MNEYLRLLLEASDEEPAEPRKRRPAPGKVALTSHVQADERRAQTYASIDGVGYLAQPVQRSARASVAHEDPFAMHLLDQPASAAHAAAAHGTEGPAQALPHLDRIQSSFGHHDVTNVKAHVGGAAGEASEAMGATAFASGDDVAFASEPDVHTAAHEAAHVVQQASGAVQLAGGVGAEGDAYERHADAVADRVVAGESAEALLDEVAGSSSAPASPAVQRQAKGVGGGGGGKRAASGIADAARWVSETAGLAHEALRGKSFPEAAIARLDDALDTLGDALHGHAGDRPAADDRAVQQALRAARQVADDLARRSGPMSERAASLSGRIEAIGRLASAPGGGARGPADLSPAELLTQVDTSLEQLAAARELAATMAIDAAGLAQAIETTEAWRDELAAPDATASDAKRLSNAVLGQQAVLFELSTEMSEVVATPSVSNAAVLAAYLAAMAKSTERRTVVAPYVERARYLRRARPLARAAVSVDASATDVAAIGAYDPKVGKEARREQAAVEAAFGRALAAGNKASDYQLRKVEVDARELAAKNATRKLETEARALERSLAALSGGVNTFDYELANLRTDLVSLAENLPILRERYQRDVDKADDEHGASAEGPWKILRAKERALDALEQKTRALVARGDFLETLNQAYQKQKDAQVRLFAQQLLSTIALTLAGNVAASMARGAAEGAWMARAARAGMTEAEMAAVTARAQSFGAAAGFAADVTVNTLGQKLQGDGASLVTILTVNVVSPLALGKVTRAFAPLAKVNKAASRWRKASGWLVEAAYDKLALSVEMITGAAVDYASRILLGAHAQNPTDQQAEEWLLQGAAMAIGRHMSARSQTIVSKLERLQRTSRRSFSDLVMRARGLGGEGATVAGSGDIAAANRLLATYERILTDRALATAGAFDDAPTSDRLARLGLETLVPDRVFEGTPDQVARALEIVRAGGDPPKVHAQADGGYRYHVVGADGGVVELVARPPATGGRGGGGHGRGGGGGGGDGVDPSGVGPKPRPPEQVKADVERASLRAANMAGGVKVEDGGVLRLPQGEHGFAVKVKVADLGAKGGAYKLALQGDGAVLTVSRRARPEQVERAMARGLTEAMTKTERIRAGKPLDVPSALGKNAKGEFLSPEDMGKIAELRVMRRQLDEATGEGPARAEEAKRLGAEIQAFEKQLGMADSSDASMHRRRMVETQVVVQNDRARRERAKATLDGDRGHSGVEVHSHFMGVVDSEVFRRKAAEAAHGEDNGSWVPVLDQLATLRKFRHGYDANGAISKRSVAGDTFEIVEGARKRIETLVRQSKDASPAAKEAIQERIEMLAKDAVEAALTATPRTDFNSAYEMRDELVKGTFAGQRPKATGDEAADKAATAEYEARSYDEYTREAIRRLARDRIGYTEQSNSAKKMAQRFGAERVRRILDELIAAGEIRPGEVDIRFLTMIPTRHFGERVDGNPEESHAGRELDPIVGKDGKRTSGFEKKVDAMVEQVLARGDTPGADIASLELYHFDEQGREAFKLMYRKLAGAARQRGQQVVLRPHVGEGAVDNAAGKPFSRDHDRKRTAEGELTHQARAKHNIDQLLTALAELRASGDLDPTLVVLRFGHATVSTPEQVQRMNALGVIAEVNLGSNVRTGSADQTVRGTDGETSPVEQFGEHALPTMLYYDTQVILSTDAHDVMQTTMRGEYERGHRIIEEILAGERKVRVRSADAGDRGKPARDGTEDRWLSIEEMTAAERERFTHAYEKLHADAEAYYTHRPRPEAGSARNQPGPASPAGGAHWTDTAREHGLRAIEGQRRFAGTRADVERAVAAFRKKGATVLPIHDDAGTIRYRVTSRDGRAQLELEGWNEHHPSYLPEPDLDLPDRTDPKIRQWYNDAVKGIPALDARWRGDGVPLEERARRAYTIRHHARIQARQMMQKESAVAGLHVRDAVVHGDQDGPSFDQLVEQNMAKGMTREEALEAIIDGARRTNKDYNRRNKVKDGGER
ncbi:MAG: DUF4157 domain-containing protein [Kofleriaceae bacterium]|nr:DUF4157 domain-containing protein [Kofleriaceae bacterium]